MLPSFEMHHIYEKRSHILYFAFSKLGLNPIYNAYLNASPFKYYIRIYIAYSWGGEDNLLMLYLNTPFLDVTKVVT